MLTLESFDELAINMDVRTFSSWHDNAIQLVSEFVGVRPIQASEHDVSDAIVFQSWDYFSAPLLGVVGKLKIRSSRKFVEWNI